MTRVQALLRFAFAALTAAAIGYQLWWSNTHVPTFRVSNFFSFFTILSNVLAVVALAVGGVALLQGRSGRGLSLVRGAATLYMTITGLVYVTLLSGLEEALQTQISWVNTVLHYLMPVVMVVDWLLDRSVSRVRWVDSLWWLLFPMVYLAYSLIRGPIVGWYPYPFLNPGPHGYLPVALTCIAIAAVAVLLSLLLAWTTRWGRAPDRPVGARG